MVEHLSDHDLALAADFLIEEKYDQLAPHIRQHIEDCEECSQHVMELSDALSEVDEPVTQFETSGLKKLSTVRSKDWLVAASLVLAIMAGAYAWMNHVKYQELARMHEDQPDSIHLIEQNKLLENEMAKLEEKNTQSGNQLLQQRDSLTKLGLEVEEKNKAIASLYTPNRELEEEMRLALRSGNLDLVSPSKKVYARGDVLSFQWKPKPKSLALVVYNNRGMKLQVIPAVANGFELSLEKFGLGKYYYELYFENDQVAIRSFEIR